MDRLPPENSDFRIQHYVHPQVDSGSITSNLFNKIKKNLFSRFTNKIFPKNSDISPLQGRINDLHLNSTEIREQLEKIKREVDLDLEPLVSGVIDPMLRSIQTLHSQFNNNSQEHEKVLPRYTKWIDQAKVWVSLYVKAKDKDEVLKAVITHIIDLSSQTIDNDLKIIAKYEAQVLNFPNDAQRKEQLQKDLRDQLAPSVALLTDLKAQNPPEFNEIKEVSVWKAELDEKRQHYFNEALQTIDSFAEKHSL